jgi:hypothetical protein
MARKGRTFEWHGDDVEEIAGRGSPKAGRSKHGNAPPKVAKLSFLNALALFSFCAVILVFAVPALMALLYVMFSVVFG